MKKSLIRSVAATTALAAGLVGALAMSPSANAGEASSSARSAPVHTNFAFRGDVFGSRLLVEGVEVINARDAYAQQRCTTVLGGEPVIADSQASVPDNPLINVAATTSRTQTYRDTVTHRLGIRGTSTISDIHIGGEVGGVQTPTISINGLRAVSNAFFDKDTGRFGHLESFDFSSMTIEYAGTPAEGTPLADLLDILNQTTGDVPGQVFDLLQQLNVPIEIPGLGSIALGAAHGTRDANSATSEAYALNIRVNADGKDSELRLGRARTRISRPVPAGVFHSTAMGLDMFAADKAIHVGNIGRRSIPCEGTGGEVVVQKIASASVLAGAVVNLTGVRYAFMGEQFRNGAANGMVSSSLAKLEIPAVNLEIRGITSKVVMHKGPDSNRVRRTISTGVQQILVNGASLPIPRPGHPLAFDGGVIETRIIPNSTFYGAEVHAVRVTLLDFDAVLDLGWAAGHIMPK